MDFSVNDIQMGIKNVHNGNAVLGKGNNNFRRYFYTKSKQKNIIYKLYLIHWFNIDFYDLDIIIIIVHRISIIWGINFYSKK